MRDALRGLLEPSGIIVVAEADGVRAAAGLPGDVVVANLVLPDGAASDLGHARPVVAYTWLVADERPPGAAEGVAALLGPGTLGAMLVDAVRSAVVPTGDVGYCPGTESRRDP